ncbi:MAG: HEAT repeat domain-containing protein [Cyanobacteria bacterium P01_A01_bin.37]
MDITPESVKALLDSDDYGSRINSVNQMRYLDPAIAVELLMEASVDDNARVRYAAVSQLASSGGHQRDAVASLLRTRLLTDAELDVRAAAADSISALKLVDLFDDLKDVYCQTTDWIVRMSIVAALGELGDPRGFEILQDALQSETDLIQTAAIGAFGELGDRRAVELICPLAESDDWQIRYRVVQALTALGGDEAKATLRKLSNDTVEQVAQEARAGAE